VFKSSNTCNTPPTSHRRTKDERLNTRHRPDSYEPRTQTLQRWTRCTCFSYAIKPSIAPASMSFALFDTRHMTTAHERPTLSNPVSTWCKQTADAFAPAIDAVQMKNVRNRTSGKTASVQITRFQMSYAGLYFSRGKQLSIYVMINNCHSI